MRTSLYLTYQAYYMEFNSFSVWMLGLSLWIKWLKNVGVKTAHNGLGVYFASWMKFKAVTPVLKIQVLFSVSLAASPTLPSLSDTQTAWGVLTLRSFFCFPRPQCPHEFQGAHPSPASPSAHTSALLFLNASNVWWLTIRFRHRASLFLRPPFYQIQIEKRDFSLWDFSNKNRKWVWQWLLSRW